MTLSIIKPTIGQANATEDQDVINAFTAIETWAAAEVPTVAQQDWQEIRWSGQQISGLTNTTYVLPTGRASTTSVAVGTIWGTSTFYLDPADYALAGRSVKYRLRVSASSNSVSNATNFTFGLYNPTVAHGTAGNPDTISAMNTVVTNSTVVLTAPATSSSFVSTSAEFSAPAAATCVLGMVLSASQGASATLDFNVSLQRKTT